jgi:hypothetical protein
MAFKRVPVVAAKIPATQSNFPVYVKPSALTGWGSITLAEAQSSRWYTDESKTVEVAREIVSADEIHVKVPSLTTTTELFVDYDGIRADYAVTDTYGRNAVWADYEFVLHGGLSSGTLVDSCGRVTTTKQTANTPTSTAGKIGDAFSANSAYWTSDYNGNTRVGTGDFTYQTWHDFGTRTNRRTLLYMARDTSDGSTYHDAFQAGVFESTLGAPATNKPFHQVRDGTTGFADDRSSQSAVDGSFRMYHVTRTGTTGRTYASGSQVYTATNANWGTNLGGTTNPVTVFAAYGTSPGLFPVTHGLIDEMRFRGSLLSANWITTEYNNQSDVATFFGTVTDAGGAPTVNNGFMLRWA